MQRVRHHADEARRRGPEVDAEKPAGAGKAFLSGGGMNCMFARYDDAEFQI